MAREIYRGEIEPLLASGALLIDVREGSDHNGEDGLPGHTHLPLSRINELRSRLTNSIPVIFYCRSGLLSFKAAEIVAGWTEQPVYYLAGGLVSYVNP